MPPVSRLGDMSTGHCGCCCWDPTAINSASSNVLTNSKGTARVGDTLVTHCCKCGKTVICHPGRAISLGYPTVVVNSMQIGYVTSAINCGDVVAEGSGNVIAGS